MAEKIKDFSGKKVIMFDVDDTLTESKSSVDQEMAELFCRLLDNKKVAIIGGGNFPQFRKQFLDYLECDDEMADDFLVFPTSAAKMYRLENGEWNKVYEHSLSEDDKEKIRMAFKKTFEEIDYEQPEKIYGELIEDRNTQMTFSALGQDAPLNKKKEWNKNSDVREDMQSHLVDYLPELEVRIGGTTSIDVTQKGIDKAYGVREVMDRFGVSEEDIVYVGDALYEGGNDEAVKRTGIDTLQVDNPEETKVFIRNILDN